LVLLLHYLWSPLYFLFCPPSPINTIWPQTSLFFHWHSPQGDKMYFCGLKIICTKYVLFSQSFPLNCICPIVIWVVIAHLLLAINKWNVYLHFNWVYVILKLTWPKWVSCFPIPPQYFCSLPYPF
jgi:hypothetical protein